MKIADYIIAGQGLAGSHMAWALIQQGQSVLVIDNGAVNASTVAAGLFNPVTGRRFVKSWLIDELLPAAEEVYTALETRLDAQFFYRKNIIRYISGHEEEKIYQKAINEENRRYIADLKLGTESLDRPYCEIQGGGFVDTATYLQAFRKYLAENNSLAECTLDYHDLVITPEGVTWKDHSAKGIIFCEGYLATQNPYFPHLPFNLVKGEVLTLKIPGLKSDKILMAGCYLAPLGNDVYKMGATYEWTELDDKPTAKARAELVQKLRNITDLPFEIIDHQAGVRPASEQRRPFLGSHPEYNNLFIFNGLGTKGVILAPYFAAMLSRYILHQEPVMKEADYQQLLKK